MNDAAQPSLLFPTVLNIVGFSLLIATGLAHWLSSRSDRKKWLNDNKKLEWRQLIDELDEGFEQMSYMFQWNNVVSAGDDRNNPMAGVNRGERVLTGRIFIADALRKNDVMTKWRDLVLYVTSFERTNVPSEENPTLRVFNIKAADFRDQLLRIAQEDLGIK